MIAGVAVYPGSAPGHPGTSDPSIFLGKGIDPSRSYTVTGLYEPALETLWSGYTPHASIQGAGTGTAITGRDVGMDIVPLTAALQAAPDAIVQAVVEPVTRRDEHGRELVLFSPRRLVNARPTLDARKSAEAFHRQHHDELRAIEERRGRRSLPRIKTPVELDAYYDAKTEELVFEASASLPLDVAWTVAYVLGPPFYAVNEIYLSSVFLGE